MNKTNKSLPQKQRHRTGFLVFGLSIIVLILGYFFVYRPIAKHVERTHFDQAEQSLTDLSAQIIAKVGQPDEQRQEQRCGYSSAKFQKGNLSCSVSTYLTFSDIAVADGNQLITDISTVSSEPLNELWGTTFNGLKPPEEKEYNKQSASQGIPGAGGSTCRLSYTYARRSYFHGLPDITDTTYDLRVTLSCTKAATFEHFPLDR